MVEVYLLDRFRWQNILNLALSSSYLKIAPNQKRIFLDMKVYYTDVYNIIDRSHSMNNVVKLFSDTFLEHKNFDFKSALFL